MEKIILMPIRLAVNIILVIMAIISIVMFSSVALDDNPKKIDAHDIPIFVFFLISMISTALFAYIYLRCPNCKNHLSRIDINKMHCSNCDYDLRANKINKK
ncbi:MAG: hypothetical protein HQK76_16810 [Desulfobacterales bacterium]|nr:hypothetical protein [Desulfobacterales bacterium]